MAFQSNGSGYVYNHCGAALVARARNQVQVDRLSPSRTFDDRSSLVAKDRTIFRRQLRHGGSDAYRTRFASVSGPKKKRRPVSRSNFL